jgi:hypothetical protein
MDPVDSHCEKADVLQQPVANVPDLTKINSSSEVHIAGINELEHEIDVLERQVHDMVHSLVAIKKRMHVMRRIVDERLADAQRQVALLKEQLRHETQPISLTITSTCDHEVLVGTT